MKETNVVVSPHNAWTLTKHVAGSINKAASNIDAKVYGTKTNVIVIDKPEPTKSSDVFSMIGIILFCVLAVGVFVLYISGHIKGRDIIGI